MDERLRESLRRAMGYTRAEWMRNAYNCYAKVPEGPAKEAHEARIELYAARAAAGMPIFD